MGEEPGERWTRQTGDVRQRLESGAAGKGRARILGEIQIVLPAFAEVRHAMHEPYKALRAETPGQLHEDFSASAGGRVEEMKGENVFNAAFRGQLGVVERLIDAGGDVDHAHPNGSTALNTASEKGHADVVGLLLAKGADVDRRRAMGWRRFAVRARTGTTGWRSF